MGDQDLGDEGNHAEEFPIFVTFVPFGYFLRGINAVFNIGIWCLGTFLGAGVLSGGKSRARNTTLSLTTQARR